MQSQLSYTTNYILTICSFFLNDYYYYEALLLLKSAL